MIFLSIFSGVVIALLIALCVFIALRFSEAFKDALLLNQATHSRSLETLDQTLDRFMAVDFAAYKLAQSGEQWAEVEQELPEIEEEIGQTFTRPETEDDAKARENETRILAEDFAELT